MTFYSSQRRRLQITTNANDITITASHTKHRKPQHSFNQSDARQERLSSRVYASCAESNSLAGLGMRASEWKNYRWNAEYCESTSRLRAFISIASTIELSLPRTT